MHEMEGTTGLYQKLAVAVDPETWRCYRNICSETDDRFVVRQACCFGVLCRADRSSCLLTSMGYDIIRLATCRASRVGRNFIYEGI